MELPSNLPKEFWQLKDHLSQHNYYLLDQNSKSEINPNSHLMLFYQHETNAKPIAVFVNLAGITPEGILAGQAANMDVIRSVYPEYNPNTDPVEKMHTITLSYLPDESLGALWESVTNLAGSATKMMKNLKQQGIDRYQVIHSVLYVPKLGETDKVVENSMRSFLDMFVKSVINFSQGIEYVDPENPQNESSELNKVLARIFPE